jgi:hypothetical protein
VQTAVARAVAATVAAARARAAVARVGVPSKLRLSLQGRRLWGSLARSRRWLHLIRHRHSAPAQLCLSECCWPWPQTQRLCLSPR